MARVLHEIGNPRAAEFQAEADDFRRCIQDSERRSAAERPLQRLNDGTWVPHLPSFLNAAGDETGPDSKYAGVIDGGWAWGILDTHLFPLGSTEVRWLAQLWEDSYTPLVPGTPDEPFSNGILDEYLHEDRIENFLYDFYSMSANTLDRETLTTYEHRSWGVKRAFELTPWAAGYWTMSFTNMLCRTEGDDLLLLQATPRRWMEDGQSISVQRLQTEFGPISFEVHSRLSRGIIDATVQVPSRQAPQRLRLRLRVPAGHQLRSVKLDGRSWNDFDPAQEWITLPPSPGTIHVEAHYSAR